MELTYTIKSTPNPLNPNEQAAGNTIKDDRCYGWDIDEVIYAPSTYTADYCNKTTDSNTFTVPSLGWAIGETVKVKYIKKCSC